MARPAGSKNKPKDESDIEQMPVEERIELLANLLVERIAEELVVS